MNRSARLNFYSWVVGCVIGTCLGTGNTLAIDFSLDIKPILAEHCIKCHGPDKAEGGLDLSNREKALQELDSGLRAIVPGKSAESQLLERVTSLDADLRMPPGDERPLAEKEKEKLRKWIEGGAEFQVHWSFRPLKLPAVPDVHDRHWVKNPIDAFVLSKLESENVRPSPEALPHQLIRRLYLDLLGLLPNPGEVDAFVEAYSPSVTGEKAYEKLVDDLLTSPHFGERWGRHWLDLARFADSDGYEKDRPRPDAYVYRDWVIKAFNDNMPFDQFTIEQLAGDLLPDATPSQRIATAFNRQTLTNTEGGVDQEEYRVAAVFDRTDTLGSVWLGLTVGCAKCHTHKYDPIPHADYYRLFAFFNAADERVESLPIKADDETGLLKEILPLEKALRDRYGAIASQEQQWEKEQRELIENTVNTPLMVDSTELDIEARSEQGLVFANLEDGSLLASTSELQLVKPTEEATTKGRNASEGAEPTIATKAKLKFPATDTYWLTIGNLPPRFTGLRLETVPDPGLGKSGAGLAGGGNFVITHLTAEILDAEGSPVRSLELQKATADFEQTGFKAADAVSSKTNSKKGWAVSPKVDKPHWLQVRTLFPVNLEEGQRIRLKVEQAYGTQHLLGRFRLRAITGDERELHLPKEIVNALKMYPEKRTNDTKDTLFDFYAQQDSEVQVIRKEIEAIQKRFKAQVMPVRLLAKARQARDTFRFDRGDFLSPAEQVQANTPALFRV